MTMTEPAGYPTDLEEFLVLANHHLRVRFSDEVKKIASTSSTPT